MYIYIYPVFNPLFLEKTILIHSSIETDWPKSTRSVSNQFILQQPKKNHGVQEIIMIMSDSKKSPSNKI